MENNLEYYDAAEFLKIVAHPVRICILKGLLKKGQCNVGYIQNCLEMPQSTISQHIQRLRTAGIIQGERNGLQINYSICDPRVEKLINILFE